MSSVPNSSHWSKWTSLELANYLNSKGGVDHKYTELFISNHITGAIAPNLTDENLKEMGIKIVGDRIRIQQVLQQLKTAQQQEEREQVLWTGKEMLFQSCFHGCFATCCGCCPQDPDLYTLRNNHLEIKKVKPFRLGPLPCGCCCDASYDIDNIDLSEINDTDVKGVPPGCCHQMCCRAVTQEHVLITTNQSKEPKVMKLRKDVGQDVARKIKNQVEIMQRMERS